MKIQTTTVPFDKIPFFSSIDVAYTNSDARLAPFYKYKTEFSSFEQIIEDKKKDPINRKVLVESLKLQYNNLQTSQAVKKNIDLLLEENTFTVTTAHQPSLATGPLYFIYKIISTLNLSESLTKQHPDYQFVPVFYLGSEDHDFEEINHFQLFGKKFEWQSGEGGSTGAMSTQHLQPVLDQLKEVLGESEHAQTIYKTLHTAYSTHKTYNDATLYLINELFKEYGLVVLIPNTADLKRQFIPIMEAELLEQSSETLVSTTINELAEAGFKAQASPRNINLFYLQEGSRERIVLENGVYNVLNTTLQFTRSEILEELNNHPEKFSPNVILRPLYQEKILPNLAYIGGGGELAYWLERKTQFKHFKLNFPMLIRRNSVLWVDKGNAKKLTKLGLSVIDLMEDDDLIIKNYVSKNTSSTISLAAEKQALSKVFDDLLKKAVALDPGLKQSVLGEKTKQLKGIDQLENKLLRAEKRKFETSNNQILSLKSKLFPQKNMQERKDNFLSFYLKYGEDYFKVLKENLHPLTKKFIILTDEI